MAMIEGGSGATGGWDRTIRTLEQELALVGELKQIHAQKMLLGNGIDIEKVWHWGNQRTHKCGTINAVEIKNGILYLAFQMASEVVKEPFGQGQRKYNTIDYVRLKIGC